jgi:hypothetical protein
MLRRRITVGEGWTRSQGFLYRSVYANVALMEKKVRDDCFS